ncbi:MAG: PH domain-containing protein [bacterium]|nr:PH domain-containing protein [bacterium]
MSNNPTKPKDRIKFFPTQRVDEHIVVMLRRHWIIWSKYVMQLILFNIIPAGIFAFLYYLLDWTIPNEGPIFVGLVLLLSFYYLSIWLVYFHQFVDYRLDVWILTDQRIINIEQQGLFDRVISELNIQKVQDVTSEIRGQAQTFLDYGDVFVQTAGEQQRFVFQNVPHPEEVARLVIKTNDASTQINNVNINHQQSPQIQHEPSSKSDTEIK